MGGGYHSDVLEADRMSTPRLLSACLAGLLLTSPVLAQPPVEPTVLKYYDFEQATDPWLSLNPKRSWA